MTSGAREPERAVQAALRVALDALGRRGLLLTQDAQLPCLVRLLTGETPERSWWSHPQGRLIFRVLGALTDHPDVLSCKLLWAKDTLVHRRLWPALLAVATAGETWQLAGLPVAARRLLAAAQEAPQPATGPAARELLARLLLQAREQHTASGRHQLVLSSWSTWGAWQEVTPLPDLDTARAALEQAAAALGAPAEALPWHRPLRGTKRQSRAHPARRSRPPRS